MTAVHQKIVQEIVRKYKKDSAVIGIRLLGSVGRGEERPDSDVDIEIILTKGNKWQWYKKRKYGVHIDFVMCSKKHLLYQLTKYPYLNYINLDKRILYDRTGILKKMKLEIKKYMITHPKVLKFWEENFKKMKAKKAKQQKPQNLIKLFDKAERLFSKKHTVTRDWFRG